MTSQQLAITDAQIEDDLVSAAAYGLGWGYCAFAIGAGTIREVLGAADSSPRALKIAFNLGRPRIARTLIALSPPADGQRVIVRDLLP
ncbi:hypothetical protein [Burkholderia sp. PAMC 28687]|uniref:hypothetical protein n=1 Tax=Burkholderia sp. PAMC 28687 TaxID=1795874 RepID=UPI000A99127A|nr:hypothetical protein [Burkholderia sp. PAMC 28687]